MDPSSTALILIGYQNDYFDAAGVLRPVLENTEAADAVLVQTLRLLEAVKKSSLTVISTPIVFSSSYAEISRSDGMLRAIKETGAFQAGTQGSKLIPQIAEYGDRIIEVSGKRGLNAFAETPLDQVLESNGIDTVVLAGAMTSICIDATGRSAYECGFKVAVLEDCTSARTDVEQDIFCSIVLPTYATMVKVDALLVDLGMTVEQDLTHGD